jgi:hypothetical protein
MKPHTLGALLMQCAIQTKEQFAMWIAREGYSKEELEKIRAEFTKAHKDKTSVQYSKVF